ncbi:hypothetical protein [Puniceibacterium sediminis]|uniref:Subtilase family protein n=1 Tax=Puniceibacterium sediminis TaxID=1608407 RepID=A0A238Z2B9_9RHOB|nr:hypothetical protein [Puniceibacterium sediminis]SNR76984.1 hypothetical protein SAMN06265370_12219 [Puniceibacterium sediminis]
MTLRWDSPVRADGGDNDAQILSPYSDWWLRTQAPSFIQGPTLPFPTPFLTRGPVSIKGGTARPVDRALQTAHPKELAPVRPDSLCVQFKGSPGFTALEPAPRKVIIGIVDDGIAFANARFLKRDNTGRYGTRLSALWNQDAACEAGRETNGYVLPFGRDWVETEINERLFVRRDPVGLPHADTAYRLAEMQSALSRCAQHGTHVMDLATGYDCNDRSVDDFGETPAKMAHLRPIVAVQLARIATRDSSGAFMATYVTHAIEFILARTIHLQPEDSDAPRIPLVLNFSYGIFAGPMNGRDQMEEWIDDAVQTMQDVHSIPVWLTLPAGNSYQSRTRGEQTIGCTRPDRQNPPLLLRRQPEDKAAAIVEFWWPEQETDFIGHNTTAQPDAPSDAPASPLPTALTEETRKHIVEELSTRPSPLRLELRPPNAADWIALDIDGQHSQIDFFHAVPLVQHRGGKDILVGMAYHEVLQSLPRKNVDKADGKRPLTEQFKLTLILAPTLFEQPLETVEFQQEPASVPSGTWEIRLWDTREIEPQKIDVRCQRNDTPFGFRPFGRQCTLVDPNYSEYRPDGRPDDGDVPNAWVLRRGTLNAIGTGTSTIRVGSVRKSALSRRTLASNRIDNGGTSAFSSAGEPLAKSGALRRASVDLAAVTEINHAAPGVLAAGTHSGSVFRFAGTSSAAPQVARWIAAMLANPQLKSRDDLRRLAEISSADYFAASRTPERTGVRVLLGPRAR